MDIMLEVTFTDKKHKSWLLFSEVVLRLTILWSKSSRCKNHQKQSPMKITTQLNLPKASSASTTIPKQRYGPVFQVL